MSTEAGQVQAEEAPTQRHGAGYIAVTARELGRDGRVVEDGTGRLTEAQVKLGAPGGRSLCLNPEHDREDLLLQKRAVQVERRQDDSLLLLEVGAGARDALANCAELYHDPNASSCWTMLRRERR